MTILNTLFDWVLSAGLRASLLVPVVLVAQWLLRKHLPTNWRHALWLPVLVALLVPALPILPFSTKPSWPSPKAPVSTMAANAPNTSSATAATVSAESSLPADEATPVFPVESTGRVVSPTMTQANSPTPIDWRVIALWTWLAGAVAVGLSIMTSFAMTMRRVNHSALPVHPDLLARVERLAHAAGLRRAPRVLRSSAVSSPAVCGLWRPVLMLNERFEDDLSEDERDLILRHELAHIRRGDLLLNAVQCALLALHWFNPLLWLAFLRARADREAACDEAVLRGEPASRRAAYGHTLLKMETAFAPAGLSLGFVGILQGGGALRARIEFILARRKLNTLSTAALAAAIALFAVLGITGGRASAGDETTGAAKPPESVASPAIAAAEAGPKEIDVALFVVTVEGKDGFINPKGKLVIPATFEKAYPFQEGLAAVQVNERWGFIDPQGRMVIEPRFTMVGFFSDGLAEFSNSLRGKSGYINRKGEVVIEPRFDTAEEFRKGVAKVGFETTRGKLLGFLADAQLVPLNYRFIDRTGAFVEDPGPTWLATGAPGELIPFTKDDKVGYIDATGKVVIPPQFVAGLPFSDGLAAARKEGFFGYIDRSGKFVIPPRFQYLNDFSEGLAGVPLGDEGWGFIDRTGKTVIPPRFGWIYGSFRHGIVEVVFDGKAGYINTKGEWVWPPSE